MTDQRTPETVLRDWTDQTERRYEAAKHAITKRIDRLDWTVLPDYWQAQYKYLIAAEISATLDRPSTPDAFDILAEIETDLRERLLKGFLRERSTAAVSRAQGESIEDAARDLLHTDFPRLRARGERTIEASPRHPGHPTSQASHPMAPAPALE